MTAHPLSFSALLEQHRSAYLSTLPGRLAQLDAITQQLPDASQRAGALKALERCAHSLAGTAGTFGFSALGEAARELELAVERAAADAAMTGAACVAEILGGLASLREHLLRVCSGAARH